MEGVCLTSSAIAFYTFFGLLQYPLTYRQPSRHAYESFRRNCHRRNCHGKSGATVIIIQKCGAIVIQPFNYVTFPFDLNIIIINSYLYCCSFIYLFDIIQSRFLQHEAIKDKSNIFDNAILDLSIRDETPACPAEEMLW